jgi:hypothetical protein
VNFASHSSNWRSRRIVKRPEFTFSKDKLKDPGVNGRKILLCTLNTVRNAARIRLAQQKDQWRVSVKTEMNPHGFTEGKEFLIYLNEYLLLQKEPVCCGVSYEKIKIKSYITPYSPLKVKIRFGRTCHL